MKNLAVSVVAALAMGAFTVAYADTEPSEEAVSSSDDGFYLGIAYGKGKLREDLNAKLYGGYNVFDELQKINYDTLMVQAGYKTNPYLAFEGRYWKSFGDNGWSLSRSGYTAGTPYYETESGANGDNLQAWGIYVKPMYPATENMDIYGLLGYGYITLNDDDYGDWLDENGFQWGFGVSYAFTEHLSLFMDYVRLVNKDYSSHTSAQVGGSQYDWNDKLFTLNVGVTYKF